MVTKITTFRLEEPYLEALDALAELYGLNGRAEVIRRLLTKVRVDAIAPGEAAERARAAIAALREGGTWGGP